MLLAQIPIPIPNPLNPIKNLFNPVEYIEGKIRDWNIDLGELLETMLINRPRMHSDGATSQFLFGNARGAGEVILITVLFVLVTLVLFLPKKMENLVQAAFIAIAFGAVTFMWSQVSLQLVEVSDNLARAAQFAPRPPSGSGGNFLPVPAMGNVIASILGLLWMAIFSFMLMIVMIIYEMIIMAGMFFAPLTLAMLGVGSRSKKAFSVVVSALIVAMLLGAPAAVLMIELGFVMLSALGDLGTNAYITAAVLNGALIFSLVIQGVLFFVTYSYANKFTGNTISKVRGSVETKPSPQQKVQMGPVQSAHAGAMRPIPVKVVSDPKPVSARVKHAVTHELARQATNAAKQKLLGGAAAKAVSAANPAAGVAIAAGTKAASRNGQSTRKPT